MHVESRTYSPFYLLSGTAFLLTKGLLHPFLCLIKVKTFFGQLVLVYRNSIFEGNDTKRPNTKIQQFIVHCIDCKADWTLKHVLCYNLGGLIPLLNAFCLFNRRCVQPNIPDVLSMSLCYKDNFEVAHISICSSPLIKKPCYCLKWRSGNTATKYNNWLFS